MDRDLQQNANNGIRTTVQFPPDSGLNDQNGLNARDIASINRANNNRDQHDADYRPGVRGNPNHHSPATNRTPQTPRTSRPNGSGNGPQVGAGKRNSSRKRNLQDRKKHLKTIEDNWGMDDALWPTNPISPRCKNTGCVKQPKDWNNALLKAVADLSRVSRHNFDDARNAMQCHLQERLAQCQNARHCHITEADVKLAIKDLRDKYAVQHRSPAVGSARSRDSLASPQTPRPLIASSREHRETGQGETTPAATNTTIKTEPSPAETSTVLSQSQPLASGPLAEIWNQSPAVLEKIAEVLKKRAAQRIKIDECVSAQRIEMYECISSLPAEGKAAFEGTPDFPITLS